MTSAAPWGAWGRISLRARLLMIAISLLIVGLAVSDVLVTGSLRGHLIDRFDEQTRSLTGVASRLPPALLPPGGAGTFAQAMTARSELISDLFLEYLPPEAGTRTSDTHSSSGVHRPRLPQLSPSSAAARSHRAFEVPDRGGGDPWRVLIVPHSAGGYVIVAASLAEVHSTLSRLRQDCLLIGCAILVVLTTVGWFAVRAGLLPLERIEETAESIAGGDLSHRVPDLAAPGTEVGQLSAALNGMLAQLEVAFGARADSEARMRRFVADASHELRTPLFGIKGFAELYRMGGLPERTDVDHTMHRIESEATRLARLVEDLLLLARLDGHYGAGDLPLRMAPMDMRSLAADALHDLHALDPTRPVELTGLTGGPPATAPVLGDESRLRQAVTNLIGNAVTHTPRGTPVRIKVGTAGMDAILTVEDEGPGISEQQASLVFERFYRIDGSRSRTGDGGTGLGLAIVHSVVTAHHGRVELRSALRKGAAFQIILPVVTDAPG